MNKRFSKYLLALACGGLLATSGLAQQQSGFYYSADLGPTLIEDVRLREFPDASPGGKVEFDPGARLSLGGGYRFNDWLLVGGETGFSVNGIKGVDATFSQVPMFATVEFRMPNKSPLVPFIGGGPGVSFSVLAIDDDNFRDGSRVDGSTSDAVFAWQAYGGVRYKINDYMSVGVAYKYLGADAPTWDVDNTSQDIRFSRTRTHSVSASFSMSF